MSEHPSLEDLQQRLLVLVTDPNYQPVKPKVLAKRLGLPADERTTLRRLIRRLARQGLVSFGRNHLVLPPPAAAPRQADEEVVGIVQRVASGAAFLRPDSGGPRDQDVYLGRRSLGEAVHGDRVRVRISGRGSRHDEGARRRGRVIEVLDRDTRQYVATLSRSAGQWRAFVDGKVFEDPIPVGDATAKGAQARDKIVIEIVRFPDGRDDPGEAVILEVLGRRGQPGVDTLSIIREFRLPDAFPDEVIAAAREQADAFDAAIGPDRADLTGEIVITIDPQDARDFDDAISLQHASNGHWLLGVHIADVAHFVPEGSPLDEEARRRATSVYLPDRVLPMLPEIISNHLASLQPDSVRYTRTVFIEMTADGGLVHAEVRATAIRSRRRFTYEEVDSFLADPAAWQDRLEPEVHALLQRMHRLAMLLRRRRLERGSLELVLPELKIELDDEGRVCGARLLPNTESHQIIEEFMLAANQAVATTLFDQQIPFLRRIHEAPDPAKLEGLTEFARSLGLDCRSLVSRFEIIRLIDEVRGQPAERALNFAVLRSMRKAVYAPGEEGHYALHFDHYCHFTSPIRRYPDLTVHRIFARQAAGHRRPGQPPAVLERVGQHCSQCEQRAETAERELTKLKLLLLFLSERIGQQFTAVITGVEEFGLFAQGLELPAEGLIPLASLTDDFYRFSGETRTLTGFKEGRRFQLGDTIRVAVEKIDLQRRMLQWKLVERLRSAAPAARSESAKNKGRGKRGQGRRGTMKKQPRSSAGRRRPRR